MIFLTAFSSTNITVGQYHFKIKINRYKVIKPAFLLGFGTLYNDLV